MIVVGKESKTIITAFKTDRIEKYKKILKNVI
jgi:hypothetical protein